jgi:uncharacterized membrane protein YGL010W
MKLDDAFRDYASYHVTSGNKLFHRIGIPLIVFSLFGMLSRLVLVQSPRIDAAIVLIALATIYYLTLDVTLAIAMAIASAILYYLGLYVPFAVHVALFVLGWIAQFIGHLVYEKKSPAFTRNLVHLLIGPLWILADALPFARRSAAGSR